MVALVAANVTLTVNSRRIGNKRRTHNVTLAFGNGTLTYPAGGVPMPAASAFGFSRFMDFLDLIDSSNADGYNYKYDPVNNKMRIYQGDNANAAAAPGVELTTAATPAATTLKANAVGW